MSVYGWQRLNLTQDDVVRVRESNPRLALRLLGALQHTHGDTGVFLLPKADVEKVRAILMEQAA